MIGSRENQSDIRNNKRSPDDKKGFPSSNSLNNSKKLSAKSDMTSTGVKNRTTDKSMDERDSNKEKYYEKSKSSSSRSSFIQKSDYIEKVKVMINRSLIFLWQIKD